MKQDKIFTDQYIVITGAAGFIGSGVVRHLNENNLSNLILVDDFNEIGKWKNIRSKKFIDIISKNDLFKWLNGKESAIEAFIHLGACSSTVEGDTDFLIENNYRFSVKLAEYAIQNEHRFIYASSAATYGGGENGFSDDHDILDNLCPLNPYGFSKHLFDLWLYRNKLLDKVIGLKYFNVFGPNENHKDRMASMIFHMFNKIQKDGFVSLFKSNEPAKYQDGDQVRDFIYVKDAVKVTCDMLLDSFKDVSGIFNVGSAKTTTWNKLATSVFTAMDKRIDIRYVDIPEDLAKQYQNYTKADMGKYEMHLKKQNKTFQCSDIDQALNEYIKDYLIPGNIW
jgi:ADP-L-glycero-D-manno-heptose 6-epimerase